MNADEAQPLTAGEAAYRAADIAATSADVGRVFDVAADSTTNLACNVEHLTDDARGDLYDDDMLLGYYSGSSPSRLAIDRMELAAESLLAALRELRHTVDARLPTAADRLSARNGKDTA